MVQPRLLPKGAMSRFGGILLQTSVFAGGLSLLAACPIHAACQAITINTSGVTEETVDRRYAQVEPTKVDLPKAQLNARGHQEILRTLLDDQGFAMRPMPRGKKGLTLVANGKLSPAGEGYMTAISREGLSVKPGERVVLTNISLDKEKIIIDVNGGPVRKHDFMRHIEIGAGGPDMTRPIVQDPGQEPTGARITLTFAKYIPDVTPAQLKALLAPLISFEIKSPMQAYTDTLPPKLKQAILDHRVLVGMNTDMVLYALGQPESKSREMEGQTPFEEWIYGHPPQDVNFVRVNGNRVIRVEVAKLGQPLEIFTKDEVEGLMRTDGRPALADAAPRRSSVQLGDVHRDADTQSPVAPPSLRKDGEKLPQDDPSQSGPASAREGTMQPVVFPKDTTKDPARTVPAHPRPTAPPEDDDANSPADGKQPDSATPNTVKPSPHPSTAPATPPAAPASKPDAPAATSQNLLPAAR